MSNVFPIAIRETKGKKMNPKNITNRLPQEAVRQRLENLILTSNGDDFASISALIGKNHAYIQQFIKRGQPSKLNEEDRKIISQHFGISEWELGGLPSPQENKIRSTFEEKISLIPHYEIHASAGDGSHLDQEYFENFLPFQTSWLKNITQSNQDKLTSISVKGDSMYPTLSDGDQILVDMGISNPDREGIYVLRISDALHVKRVTFNPISNRISIKSDNPLYDSWDDLKPENVDIVGRVIWVGRKL